MKKLSKFDVLLYIADLEGGKNLAETIRKNIHFQEVSGRVISERLRELRKMDLVKEGNGINGDNRRVFDYLTFLYWCKLREKNYNELLEDGVRKTFGIIFEACEISLGEISRKTGFTRQTVSKYLDILDRNNFVHRVKEKPLVIRANLNDLSFFYVNVFDFSFNGFEKRVKFPKMRRVRSEKISKKITELHVYSTTVTEGNTATEEEVEKVFDNFPVDLTPREVLEIVNTRKALERLCKIKDREIETGRIKELHEVLMANLVEKPGEFEYGRKRIIGSDVKLPTGKKRVDYSIKSLCNFWKRESGNINPQLMGCLLHFIFVSIHPFMDGNGRIGRFLHSWVLLKSGMPLFVFDPNKRNKYFEAIEEGRKKSIENFVLFCINEHRNILEKLK